MFCHELHEFSLFIVFIRVIRGKYTSVLIN